jgi:U4/U6 small nuclear ribonucleoprotein SNU13
MPAAPVYLPAPEEKTQKVLRFVQSMAKSGNVRKGINEATKCLNRGTALLVLIACDAEPPEITAFLPVICEDKGVPYLHLPSKHAMGTACGVKRPIAACSVYCPKEKESLRLDEKVREILQ